MKEIALLIAVFAGLALIIFVMILFAEQDYEQGYEQGYQQGYLDCAQLQIIGVECLPKQKQLGDKRMLMSPKGSKEKIYI